MEGVGIVVVLWWKVSVGGGGILVISGCWRWVLLEVVLWRFVIIL